MWIRWNVSWRAAFLQPKGVEIGLADPMGAAYTLSIKMVFFLLRAIQLQKALDKGELREFERFMPDFSYQINDEEALNIVFDLWRMKVYVWAALRELI